MKKIILSSSLALLLATKMTYGETEAPEQIEAEKAYQLKIDKAKVTLDKANDAFTKDYEKYGVFHPKVLEDYKTISEAYFTMGQYDGAIENALKAMKVAMKIQKEDDPVLAKLYFDTGNKYYMYKQHPTAILYMEKALEIYNNAGEKDTLILADTYEAIASTYINLEDFEKSLAYEEKCLAIRSKKLKKDNESLQRAIMNIEYLKGESEKIK